MIKSVELQPWLVMRGASQDYAVVQEVGDWVDASGHDVGTVSIEAPEMTNCALYLEGCEDRGGVFMSINELTSSSPLIVRNLLRAMPQGAPQHLYNYMRWAIHPSANAWSVTFRVSAILK